MQSTTCRRLALLVIFGITLYFVWANDGAQRLVLLAAESPLAQPWPTLVVAYPPQLNGLAPPATPATQEVRVSFLFHSPLALPTPLPDALPPTTTLTVTGELGNEGWLRSPATLTFAIADNIGAGVSEYRLTGSDAWTEREYYYPPPRLDDDGVYTLAYRSIDMAHNAEAIQRRVLRIDRTPPQLIAPLLAGNQLANGWFNTPVRLQLGAEDALSGLSRLERLDQATGWQATAAVTTLSQTGQHTLTWRAVDRAGNVTPAQQMEVLLDLPPPPPTPILSPTATGDWFNQPVSVTLEAVDEGAGVFATSFRLNNESSWRSYAAPFSLSEDGRYTLTYYSSDRALNLETLHTVPLAIDHTPPQLAYTVNGRYPPPDWVATAATLDITATDALAGVAQVDYALDEGAWQHYAAPSLLTTPGQHHLRLQASDGAGNQSSVTTAVGIDTGRPLGPPQSALLLEGGRGPNGWFVTPVTLTLSAVDGESGLAQRQFRLNGGAWQSYMQPVLLTSQPLVQLEYRALDQVGNQEAANLARFNLDLSDPTAYALIRSGQSSPTGWYISPVTFALQGMDGESGVQQIEYRVDQGDWQPYTGEFALDEGGQHQLAYRAVDRSGRLGPTRTISAWIDLTAPLIQSDFAALRTAGAVDLSQSFVPLDPESGLQTVTYLLNGAPYQPGCSLLPGLYPLQVAAVNRAGLRLQQVHTFVVGGMTYLPLVQGQ
ncbi:MAG TPA: hypothetical protein PKE45_15765 [Caldilineaceae bacterium]|nr:hypothetical protein [Caldilineaceae bacterium]